MAVEPRTDNKGGEAGVPGPGKKEEEGRAAGPEKAAAPAFDPYLSFVQSRQITTPEDVAVYKTESGYIVVFLDPVVVRTLGVDHKRSSLECSVHITKAVWEKMAKAIREGEKIEKPQKKEEK